MEESKESFFSELLSSGGEIEGLFQQKKRVGLENFTFAGAFRNLGEILPEQIATYNRRKSIQYHLVLEEVSALLHKLLLPKFVALILRRTDKHPCL